MNTPKWKARLNEETKAQYAPAIQLINAAKTDDGFRAALKFLIELAPFSYHNLISKNEMFGRLRDFIIAKTPFASPRARMSTRCWYVVHGFKDLPKCRVCGKLIAHDIQITRDSEDFWCGPKCQAADEQLGMKIKRGHQKRERRISKSRSDLPPESALCVGEG